MPITIQNSAGGGVTLDSSTSSNETINLNTPVFTGNVGIGVVPEAWYSTSGSKALQVGNLASIFSNSGNNSVDFACNFYQDSVGDKYLVNDYATRIHSDGGQFAFDVAPSGTADAAISWNTAMTIDNSGSVLVGKSSASFGVAGVRVRGDAVGIIEATSANTMLVLNRLTSDGPMAGFYKDGTAVGSISVNASATAYNTSSDYRLKTNVTPMVNATAAVKLLKPCNFDWIADGSNVNGFLAHELAEVVPEAATGTKDAMRDEEYEVTPATDTEAAVMGTRSVPDMQGIDQSKLVPLLTATIQELIARIEALENV